MSNEIMCMDCGKIIETGWKHFPTGKVSCEDCLLNKDS